MSRAWWDEIVLAPAQSLSETQTAITAYFTSRQILLFAFAWRSLCQYSMAEENPAAQRQTAVTAYLKSKQLLLLDSR